MKNFQSFLDFIEISKFGIENIIQGGNFAKEGYILKKSQGKNYGCFKNMITCGLVNCCRIYQKRWFILQDEMICYLDYSTSDIGKDV